MITLFHGDNLSLSRKAFLENKAGQSIVLDGEKISLTDLVQIFEGGSLFEEKKSILIENLFRKKGKEFEEITNYLQKIKGEVCLWEGKELSKKQLAIFQNDIVKTFKLPKSIFLFVDSLAPKQGKNLIKLFHETLVTTNAEIVSHMLIRQLRFLIAIKELSTEKIDEIKSLASWQISKFKKQSSLFSIDELKKIYHQLFEIDLKQKTGKSPFTLTQDLDFFLLEI